MSTDAVESAEPQGTTLPSIVGWIALFLLTGYALFIHQGMGSPPGGYASLWWHPTQYLILSETVGGWADIPALGTLYLTAPAALLVLLVFLGMRSAIGRALALSLAVTIAAFCYVGFSPASTTWELFHWRLSAVMVWTGLALGCAVMSPSLTASWLRRSRVVQVLLYVPVAFAIVAVIRNATGTDETLFSNFSPWPAISVIGLEIGAYTIVGILIGLAVGVGALSQWGRRPAVALLGALVGVIFPSIWLWSRFGTAAPGLVMLAILSAVILGLAAITRGGDRPKLLTRRAFHMALGAVLVAVPMFTGRAWANADYTLNKFVRAKIAQDALAEYFEKKGVYPDRLQQLVEDNYLEEIPRPRVGFDFLYDFGILAPIAFSYRGLGSSYVLEFVSTEWMQCAYNPPWAPTAGEYEYEDEEYDEEYAGEDDESGDAWSCPATRPALWGSDQEPGEEEDY